MDAQKDAHIPVRLALASSGTACLVGARPLLHHILCLYGCPDSMPLMLMRRDHEILQRYVNVRHYPCLSVWEDTETMLTPVVGSAWLS